MEHSQPLLLTGMTILFCACVTLAIPAGRPDDVQNDLSSLARLLGKLNEMADGGQEDSNTDALNTGQAYPSGTDRLAALKRGFQGFDKRQGAWSYDYGLGGGRFGKRYYSNVYDEYGIGGGRFGRDVDHVDLADTNDSSL